MRLIVRGEDKLHKIDCYKCESTIEYTQKDFVDLIDKTSSGNLMYKGFKCPCCGSEIKIKFIGVIENESSK